MRYKEFIDEAPFDTLVGNLVGTKSGGLGSFGIVDKIKGIISGDKETSTSDKEPDTTGKPATGKPATTGKANIQDPNFDKKLAKVADALGIQADILRKIIKFETAGTFSPTSHDPWNVSIGLIGFTEQTARGLGTSKAALAKMTAVQQLDYVYQFYKNAGVRPGSDIGTVYMLTFMPAYAYSPNDTVLGKKGGGQLGRTGLSMHKVWEQNPSFGKSRGKNFFTVGDVKNFITARG
jgi:hypothetical protein